MANPAPERRVHKRLISDQQKRRDAALLRQKQDRKDLKNHARHLASIFLAAPLPIVEEEQDGSKGYDESEEEGVHLLQATRLKGAKAREWFKQQFMYPEWMVDVPDRLGKDWYVLPRPAGQRCIVISSDGMTISRLRNGQILHRFSSRLPCGARTHNSIVSARLFCILDCIFHEPDNTYYVIDLMCWQGCSLYDCDYEFRSFWIKSKIGETQACDPPSPSHLYPPSPSHLYRFGIVPAMECSMSGLETAYRGPVPFERDGCLFVNKQAHYVLGVTPLALLWKDSACSRYAIDTDSKGDVPTHQQVVLKLQDSGTVVTCDEPAVILGVMPQQFLDQNKKHLKAGMLLKFALGDQGLKIVDSRPIVTDIHYQGLANRSRAAADSVSKILFQYAARHAPLTIFDLYAAVQAFDDGGGGNDVQMA